MASATAPSLSEKRDKQESRDKDMDCSAKTPARREGRGREGGERRSTAGAPRLSPHPTSSAQRTSQYPEGGSAAPTP